MMIGPARSVLTKTSWLARSLLVFGCLSWLSSPERAWAWGNETHPAVVRLAIAALPEQFAAEFRRHSRKLERFSNEPDTVLRAKHGRVEAMRHFIDLDGYMQPPFERFPRTHAAAVSRIGKRKVEKFGILPWVIMRKAKELEEANRNGGDAWVRVAGHLAHYVADAYQPLHLTIDYDGKRHGSKGIHRRLENDLVDARIEAYERRLRAEQPKARVVMDLRGALFADLFDSYGQVDGIFRADHAARRQGAQASVEYRNVLESQLGDMCRSQLRKASLMLASIWLNARDRPADPDR